MISLPKIYYLTLLTRNNKKVYQSTSPTLVELKISNGTADTIDIVGRRKRREIGKVYIEWKRTIRKFRTPT